MLYSSVILEKYLDIIYQLWYNPFKHYISKILKVCTISNFNTFSRNFQCLNYHNEQAEGIFRNIYMAYVFEDNLYGRKLIKIPEPRFVVFYNGTDKMPEQSVLRLSDAYESKSEELDLELRIRFVNINPGYNEEMIERSPTLYQYVKFVDTVRKYQQEMPFPEAVEKAIDECIKKGILAEFLRKNRAEVLRVSIFEYDEEEHMRQEREESRQEGIEQVNDLYDKLHDLNREEDIWKAIKDVEYRKKLLEEFHLD